VKVVRFNSADRYEPEKDWKRVSLCSEKDISIEHFVKPPRHASPHHGHPAAQILVVLQGKMSVTDDAGTRHVLAENDCIYIPGEALHTVTNELDTPSVGLDIFVPGRSFDFWLKRSKKEIA
jgi:quercetin dioxygenase-like cupin family protein